jgi:hypothetical protein
MKPKKLNASLHPMHEDFYLGQGYASGEQQKILKRKLSTHQYGDNPLPSSGGGYAKAGLVQPQENETWESVEVIPVRDRKAYLVHSHYVNLVH